MRLELKNRESCRFTSKELDEETGLYYYGGRYYEPTSSRWMSADPAGFGLVNPMGSDGKPRAGYSVIESLNWYSYVSNNPVKYVDPTGEKIIEATSHQHQNDEMNAGKPLGSIKTRDADGPNTIGKYGCLATASTNIINSGTGRSMSVADFSSAKTSRTASGDYFEYHGSEGNMDVLMSTKTIQAAMDDFLGPGHTVERLKDQEARDEIEIIAGSLTEDAYVIAKFEGDYGAHFVNVVGLNEKGELVVRDTYDRGDQPPRDYTLEGVQAVFVIHTPKEE